MTKRAGFDSTLAEIRKLRIEAGGPFLALSGGTLTGALTVDSTLNVTGAVTLDSTLTVTGNLTANGAANAIGDAVTDVLTLTGLLKFAAGNVTPAGNGLGILAANVLGVFITSEVQRWSAAASKITGTLNVTGAVTLDSTLVVTSTINSQTISTTSNFTGTGANAVSIQGGLIVGASGATDDRGITFTQDWIVRRDNDVTGNLRFYNGATLALDVTPAGALTVLTTLTVSGATITASSASAVIGGNIDIGQTGSSKRIIFNSNWAMGRNDATGDFRLDHSAGGAAAINVAVTTGVVTIANLAGIGSRTVVADANGVLSAP